MESPLPPRVSTTSLAQAPVVTESWHLARRRTTAGPKAGDGGSVAAFMPYVYLSVLNYQAGGDLHIQLSQHGGSSSNYPSFPGWTEKVSKIK
jgi:hypothetical protein